MEEGREGFVKCRVVDFEMHWWHMKKFLGRRGVVRMREGKRDVILGGRGWLVFALD